MTTLDALRQQTYPGDDFEVVVVSDGSTDGTDDALRARAVGGGDPYRLRPVRQDNAGPSRARNRGVQEACGAVIVFLDDDVEPSAGLLAAHMRHHAAGTERVAVIGPMNPAPDRRWKEPVWVAWEHAMLGRQYEAWRTGRWDGAGPNHFYSGNASLRREFLIAVGGFDETFKRQEDVELAERLWAQFDFVFQYDPDAAVLHRPVRRFASWLAIPRAYGRLDMLRAARPGSGAEPWEDVRSKAYRDRNEVTRLLVRRLFRGGTPMMLGSLRSAMVGAARALYSARRADAAFALMSTVYNLTYVEGALDAVGGSRMALGALLFDGDSEPARRTICAATNDSGVGTAKRPSADEAAA
jgi:glycosyltransferase involved in cell wall biosynthesis